MSPSTGRDRIRVASTGDLIERSRLSRANANAHARIIPPTAAAARLSSLRGRTAVCEISAPPMRWTFVVS